MEFPIVLDVVGIPASQGSHQGFINPKTGRVIITTAGSPAVKKAHKEWRKAVCDAGIEWRAQHPEFRTLDEPVEIQLSFWIPLTKSDPYQTRHAVKNDWDKLSRSVCDSLTDSKLIFDDSRIFKATVVCLYARTGESPGVRIRIWGRGIDEARDREALKLLAKEEREARRAAIK